MRNACSPDLVPGVIGNLSIITRGLRRPRSPVQTGFRRWWPAAIVISATLTSGGIGAQPADPQLIEDGRKLFMKETFNGNGRTCATCHPPTNNFTIDPAYIRTLKGNDPLFLATPSAPHLKSIEVRRLLQNHALVLENVDGLDKPGVLRGVPHTLALNLSLKPDVQLVEKGIVHGTGWGGDGSPNEGVSADGTPNDGSLRSFAVGAVKQHFTKSPDRVEGVDFRLPTDYELKAMEAFQRSLGRSEEMDLASLMFTDDFLNEGLRLFNVQGAAPSRQGSRRCSGCHTNAGANGGGVNRNRATGTMFVANAPACLLGFVAPLDGGFGVDDSGTRDRKELCGTGPNGGPKAVATYYGDLTMNTAPVVEAADTTPLFHNNSAATVEDAVRFYTTDTFDKSDAGGGNAFVLTEEQVAQIGAFMRGINGLQNIEISNEYNARAMDPDDPAPFDYLVEVALSETIDAVQVLRDGPVELFPGTTVIADLEEAAELERQALADGTPNVLADAIALKNRARDAMIIVP